MSDSTEKSPEDLAREAHAKMLKERVASVRSHLRVTKVIATRCIRTQKGDFFCGMSSAWNSAQDSTDLDVLSDSDVAESGMSLEDSKIAHILLTMEVGIGAHRAAVSEGALTNEEYENRVKQIKRNTLVALQKILPFDEAVAIVKNAEAA